MKFHNGNAFNADDVVFSLERALQPTSDMKGLLTSIDKVSKVDDYTVHIKTKGPNPLLPDYLTNLYMMDKEWAEANNTITVQDYKAKKDNFAVRNANGTGRLHAGVARAGREDRAQAQRRLLGQGPSFRSASPSITYLTIKSDATRVAALLSGEVDFVQDVPVQDIDRLREERRASRSISAPRTAPSSSAWTWPRPSSRPPTSRARTRSPTSACARPSTWPSTARPSSAR